MRHIYHHVKKTATLWSKLLVESNATLFYTKIWIQYCWQSTDVPILIHMPLHFDFILFLHWLKLINIII